MCDQLWITVLLYHMFNFYLSFSLFLSPLCLHPLSIECVLGSHVSLVPAQGFQRLGALQRGNSSQINLYWRCMDYFMLSCSTTTTMKTNIHCRTLKIYFLIIVSSKVTAQKGFSIQKFSWSDMTSGYLKLFNLSTAIMFLFTQREFFIFII